MAQDMFQMPNLQYDPQHENVQGVQQTALLRSVSVVLVEIYYGYVWKCQHSNKYQNRHIPKAKATTVVETPEMRRLAENTKLQSQVYFKYI